MVDLLWKYKISFLSRNSNQVHLAYQADLKKNYHWATQSINCCTFMSNWVICMSNWRQLKISLIQLRIWNNKTNYLWNKSSTKKFLFEIESNATARSVCNINNKETENCTIKLFKLFSSNLQTRNYNLKRVQLLELGFSSGYLNQC